MPATPSGIHWDSRGPQEAPPVLLIEGFTGQLIGWRDGFCDLLVERGLRVLRMDNRDIGLSRHEAPGTVYSVADMARDAAEVLVEAGAGRATVVGQSMGGLIAQHLAMDRPDLVSGLVLFYTTPTTGIIPADALQGDLVEPTTEEEAIEVFLAGNRGVASPAWGYDEVRQRALAAAMWRRDRDFSGHARQRAAILAMPDTRPRLREVTVPVALVHGRADALIPPAGSMLLLEELPQAELHLHPGMGHEIAEALWPEFVAVIARLTRAARTPAVPRPGVCDHW
ncbi:alpha/beta hydrolase [Rathayibacter caricis DSM 15933]|uniref:Alpha/beta hydrolase n=1 Tax=Rathayibacter caricis DSM 15933 TaxID=1328867 RepID=A0A2T4USE1_9MICO|nr:alpha/beta hydrolase [Rathayibacter caricis]MCJ1697259.1 alpha/beta hydrolase [Rathayibacter caricis]PTL72444.1 alpha/beta hydrolase [Rathayibacter caricis DSM 15933]